MILNELDKKIISYLQGDIPDSPEPYQLIAEMVGISQEDLFAKINAYKKEGIIRRFGAVLYHRPLGLKANAMVAWRVPSLLIQKVGEMMAAPTQVTHCYERATHKNWPYNLYTMIHARTQKECRQIVESISKTTGISDCKLLYSSKEFKKTSMKYV